MATKPGDRLMAALDAASYEWMEQQYPLILAALEADMAAGLSVQDAKRLAYERTGADRQIALRIEQAARHITGGR